MDELTIRRTVREVYAGRMKDCCGPESASDCGCSSNVPASDASSPLLSIGKMGVGSPVSTLDPRPGEIVVDLGSGPGHDVLEAAERVGPNGRAIGVDATAEMVYRAREAAQALGRSNAEFRLGEIEHLPIESGTVDAVTSDCVINLSPDKAAVFREAFRILKPGGRIVVSDVVADRELPAEVRRDAQLWAACIAGAETEATYLALLRVAGFEDLHSEKKGVYAAGLSKAVVTARKPRTAA